MYGPVEAPGDELVWRALSAAWTHTFKRDSIGPDEYFFELGGTSVLAVELLERLADRTGIELPVLALFQNPSIRELAHLIAVEHRAPDAR